MKDTRPLSERFDLTYVRRKHFADAWTGRLGFFAAAATAVALGGYQIRGDDRPYTAGPLSKAHDMFASDCTLCHAPSMDKGLRGFLMPASDELCLKCHAGQAGLHAENQADLFTMAMPGHPNMRTSANCAACHIEHMGRDHDLSAVTDHTCVKCHEDLQSKGMRQVIASALARTPATAKAEPAPASSPAPTVPAGSKPTEGGPATEGSAK